MCIYRELLFKNCGWRTCVTIPPIKQGSSALTIDQVTTARSHSPRRPGRPKIESPNPIDIRVGTRLRLRRNMLGLSQEKLGAAIGLTFQQIQKYERGANRIGASRLFELSRVLDVPVSFFFDDTDPVRAPAVGGFAEPPAEAFESDLLRKPETTEIIRAFFAIDDPAVRRRLMDLAKALAAKGGATAETSPARAAPASR